jgi:hypothetical protein
MAVAIELRGKRVEVAKELVRTVDEMDFHFEIR